MCADHAHGDMQRGNEMVMPMDMVRLLVQMEGRGLTLEQMTTELTPVVDACVKEEWIMEDVSGNGYVTTILGMQRLVGFRALFDLDPHGRPM